MITLVLQLEQFANKVGLFRGASRLIIAVSGGIDSMVLLHALVQIQKEQNLVLHVATFDHQIRGAESAGDAAFVRESAERLGLPVTVGAGDVTAYAKQHGIGIEAAARHLRYAFLTQVARAENASLIATAHHRDDQSETILLHVLRGSGLAGLRGMRPRMQIESGLDLIRPLLETPRALIEQYALDHKLAYREDSTNRDTTYLRNRLRHVLLPQLREFNGNLDTSLLQLSDIASADFDALMSLVPQYPYDRVVFRALPLAVRRMAIHQNPGHPTDLSFNDIENALHFIETGRTGDSYRLTNGLYVQLTFNQIVVSRDHPGDAWLNAPLLPSADTVISIPIDHTFSERLNAGWEVYFTVLETTSEATAPLEIRFWCQPGNHVLLRARRTGDVFRPAGLGGHHQKLNDTMTNMKIPPSVRDRIALVILNEEIIAFAGPTPSGVQMRRSQTISESIPGTPPMQLCSLVFRIIE